MRPGQRVPPGVRRRPLLALACAAFAVLAAACTSSDPQSSTTGASAAALPETNSTRNQPTASPERPEASPEGVAAVYAAAEAFAASPRAELVEALVDVIGTHPDPRWTPYLVDIIHISFSSNAQAAAAKILPITTGVEGTGRLLIDYTVWGATLRTNPVEPGPPYRAVKAALYSAADPALSDVLETVEDTQVLIGLQWGGVQLGGIPELNDPVRTTTAPSWATPDELVLGAEVDGTTVLYPLRILSRHELANDTVAGRPVALAFCTLCRSALLFDRTVAGQVLDFQTSGLLLDSNKVMIDRQTGSLWQQLTGVAVAGPLVGSQLEVLSVTTTTWSAWVGAHPDTEVIDLPAAVLIDAETGARVTYAYSVEEGQFAYVQSDSLWFPVSPTPPDSLAPKDEVGTVALGADALAVELTALAELGPVALALGDDDDSIVVVVPTEGGGAAFFDARGLDLAPGEPVTVEGDPLGRSVTVTGQDIPRLDSGRSFWFAWYGLHPETAWWPTSE